MSECFHCGLPVPAGAKWSVTIDLAARPMCCPGCEAAAQAIVDFGLSDYYRERSALAPQAGLVPAELLLYDQPQDTSTTTGERSDVLLSIEGIRCAACSWLIERRLARQDGVFSAQMNLATERLQVSWDPARSKLSTILAAIHGVGYVAYPCDPKRQDAALQRAARSLTRRLFVAGLAMMQVMMYAVPAYIAHDGTLDNDMAQLMRWASLLLTLPAVLYSAQPFFSGAWNSLKTRAVGMDVPVALGIAAGFLGSVHATVAGSGEVYFDSVTMFIFLLLCSRWLELRARRNAASALDRLQQGLPAAAARLIDYPASRACEIIAPAMLRVGDIILVKPGEELAADGVIVEGRSALDLSLLTGESVAQGRGPGEHVPGGAINAQQAILVRVERTASDSTLSVLLQLVERAGLCKPRLALWADQVAGWFVLGLLVFAAAVFLFWSGHDALRAWPIAIAVLVVSCPCALSLATPTALAAATDLLIRRGVLIVKGHALETLQRSTHIVFDKTGTLTQGHPVMEGVEAFGTLSAADCLQVAAALEAGNAHPLANAFVAAAAEPGRHAEDQSYTSGEGVSGTLDATFYRLGSANFVAGLCGAMPADLRRMQGETQETSVYLGSVVGWLARFDLSDGMRDDALRVVQQCQAAGKTIIVLSGDRQIVVERLAERLGIDIAHGGYLPEQKLAFVQDLQKTGAVVAMVGDGINDAAVLSAADVSFAMGSGAALAQAHADAVLLGGRLSALTDALQIADRTMRVIRQNLGWALLYNLLAIPAAAIGIVGPLVSGIGMSASSIFVVLNAWRLRRTVRPARN
jgi:Cu2+-exporting ATPase